MLGKDYGLVITGDRVILRPPIKKDKETRLSYGRDPEYRKMVGGDPRTNPELIWNEVEKWYDQVKKHPFYWIIEYQGKCIGTAKLYSVDEQNRRAGYAIGIFDKQYWEKGLGTEVTQLVLKYAFEKLNLHRIDLKVLSFNHRAIACYEKCGFVKEGIEREGSLIGGEWCSDIIFSILEQEYHTIKE